MLTKEKVEAMFLLADIQTSGMYEIRNEYGSEEYRGPWWLVKTAYGLIKIGWRKRVINIDWEDTLLRVDENAVIDYEFHKLPLTRDNTTMWDKGIHAWSYSKAVEYLAEMKTRMGQVEYSNSPEGIADLAKRKIDYLAENAAKATV